MKSQMPPQQFADDTKLGGVGSTPESSAAPQTELEAGEMGREEASETQPRQMQDPAPGEY